MSILNHIAIIPDGNRRWAKARLLNPWDGHTEGVKRFWEIAESANSLGIKYMTFWAASYGNLTKRTPLEVKFLVSLLRQELSKPELRQKLIKGKIRLRVIGEWKEIINDSDLEKVVTDLEQDTSEFTDSNLTILFGYDGQREMLSTVNSLIKNGSEASSDDLHGHLWTGDLPDVDLVVRTGGEPHWSAGFLMWQTANSQFYFTDMLWPDFKQLELKKALDEFERRERRLGK